MIQEFEQSIKNRVLGVFLLVHVGLGLSMFGIGKWVALNGMDGISVTLLLGVFLLYLGVLLGVFFIVWPLLPWIRKAREARNWVESFMQDIPGILAVVRQVIALWNDFKSDVSSPTRGGAGDGSSQ
jgi:uncharacterized membrane protein